jgi:diguanylate cyclase (GGDEF)-like protein/PAS domain S-box-containing protein
MTGKASETFDFTTPGMAEVVLRSADDGVVIVAMSSACDGGRRIAYVNDAYLRMTGYLREELIGQVPRGAAEGKVVPDVLRRVAAQFDSGEPFRDELMVLRRDGSGLWVDFSARPVRDIHNRLTHWVCVQRDISRHKTAMAELARHARDLEEMQALAKIGSWRWEIGADGIYCSAETCAMVGLPRKESFVPFAALESVTDPKDFRTIKSTLQKTAALGQSENFEYPIRTLDAATRIIWARTYPELDSDGRVMAVCGLNQDVTERLRIEQSLRWNATHDRLTGLINMSALHDCAPTVLASAMVEGATVVLAVIDLDHLKLVNDTLGHAVGDGLIREASRRLLDLLGNNGHVARLGGDEFVFLGTWKGSIEALAEFIDAVVGQLKQPFDYQGRQLDCTASIGIVVAKPNQVSVESLMRNADMAMYRAKDGGRGGFCFFSDHMQDEVDRRLAQNDLAKLAVSSKLVVPFFQPQYSLLHKRVTGFEALMRLELGDRILTPDAIRYAFENVDLATRLGNEMLRKVLEQLRLWHKHGFAFGRVALNASGMELLSKGYADQVLDALARAGVPSTCIEIEVTEDVLMGRGAERLIDVLRRLRDAGVSVALDDFGTGYASLTHLKSLPINRIKIDKSFVRDITLDQEDAAIVSATVSLAHALSLGVVAEGVETPQQAQFLHSVGCDVIQGHLFGRPAPASEWTASLDEERKSA